MALFSWVPIYVDWTKITYSWSSKFVAIVFPFIIHMENSNFLYTEFCGSDPPRKSWKLVPHEIEAIHSICNCHVGECHIESSLTYIMWLFQFVAQTGPVHAPTFIMCVEVNGTKFEGQGTTKKNAKLQAAEKALKSFVQFPNASEVHKVMGRKILDADFTSDDAAIDHSGDTLFNDFENGAEEMEDVANTKPVKVVLFICNVLINRDFFLLGGFLCHLRSIVAHIGIILSGVCLSVCVSVR